MHPCFSNNRPRLTLFAGPLGAAATHAGASALARTGKPLPTHLDLPTPGRQSALANGAVPVAGAEILFFSILLESPGVGRHS